MKFRWPRGKYNGQKIVGFSVDFKFVINYWGVSAQWNVAHYGFRVGPFLFKFNPVYSWRSE